MDNINESEIPPMRVLGLESSCDETGVAIYEAARGITANVLHSQVSLHRQYGGVVPELCFERRSSAVEQVSPTRRARARQPQCVQPERLDFDGFTDSRRHDVVADRGVEPRRHGRLVVGRARQPQVADALVSSE